MMCPLSKGKRCWSSLFQWIMQPIYQNMWLFWKSRLACSLNDLGMNIVTICWILHTLNSIEIHQFIITKSNTLIIIIIIACFFPVVAETLGPLSDEAHSLMAEIGKKATLCTADPREITLPYQRISVAIQHFNAVCLANTFTVSESPS